jgi:thioredoxin reductase
VIYDAAELGRSVKLKADLLVVGSGAGGLAAATVAAEAGLKTVILEAGRYLTAADMTSARSRCCRGCSTTREGERPAIAP